MTSQRLIVSFAAAATVLLVGGCNSEKLPGLGRVTGTITIDGKPVPEAVVIFTPKEAGATASMGRTDSSGQYELYYSRGTKGAKIGAHNVSVSDYHETGDGDTPQIHKETIPARYNVMTELTADVKGGSNTVDFALKSGGEIIQPNEEAGAKRGRSAVTGCW
jgi:hypothetical protein